LKYDGVECKNAKSPTTGGLRSSDRLKPVILFESFNQIKDRFTNIPAAITNNSFKTSSAD
jgi:hypothetical protein